MNIAASCASPSDTPVSGDDSRGQRELSSLLDALLDAFRSAWPSTSPMVQRTRNLRERLRDQRLQLAVLGQFKRGKSTFLNALLGAPVLPTGVIPLTAVPTFISWGPAPAIRVTYKVDGAVEQFEEETADDVRTRLYAYVAEEANPKNRLNVARLDLMYPSALLKQGVVLIDTPGIGSTHRHNTDMAVQVLAECDAAMFVVSADPPITEAELMFLTGVRENVSQLFFVQNKADYLAPEELEIATAFLRTTLQQPPLSMRSPSILSVSALQGLEAKLGGDSDGLMASGIADLETHLLLYLANEKKSSLHAAISRKALALAAEAAADLSLRVRALEMPLEDLESRRATLEKSLGGIANEKLVINDLLAGDRRRVLKQLEMYAEQLRKSGNHHLVAVIAQTLSHSTEVNSRAVAQEAVSAAIPEFFERKLRETSHEFSQALDEMLATHQSRVDGLANLVRRIASDLFDVPYVCASSSDRYVLRKEPYWVTQRWSDRIGPIPSGLLDSFLPAAIRQKRMKERLQAHVGELVLRNVENLRWATLQNVNDTFRHFDAMLQKRLSVVIDATRGAIDAALRKRTTASLEANAELAALHQTTETLSNIQAKLKAMFKSDV